MTKSKAVALRLEGKSLNEIMALLEKPKTTIWAWIKDVKMTSKQCAEIKRFEGNDRKLLSQKLATQAMVAKFSRLQESDKEIGRLFIRSFTPLPLDLVAVIMLYWAEGKKSPGSSFGFSNSDPSMIKLVFDCLIKYGFLDRQSVKVGLNFYDDAHSSEVVESFWLELLGLNGSHLYKSQINNKPQLGAGSKIGKLPYGVCCLIHPTKKKKYEMLGMIEEVRNILGA